MMGWEYRICPRMEMAFSSIHFHIVSGSNHSSIAGDPKSDRSAMRFTRTESM
jgi:hypothetical protein